MGKSGSKMEFLGAESPFDVNRLEEIPADLKASIEEQFIQQNNYIDQLKKKYDRLTVDTEQRHFELERQLLSSKSQYESEAKTASDLRNQVTELESRYCDTSAKFQSLQESNLHIDKELDELKRTTSQLTAEKQALSDVLDKKNQEIDRLIGDWKANEEKVNAADVARVEALLKVDEAQTQLVTVQYQVQRQSQEIEHLHKQNEWLEKELAQKTTERKDKLSHVLELQAQLDEKTEEIKHLENDMESLKQIRDESNAKVEQYLKKYQDSQDIQVQLEEQYRNEVESYEKLITLYKEGVSDSEEKSSQLVSAVEHLQKMVKQSAQEYADLTNQMEETNLKHSNELQQRDEKITKLNNELKNANELLEVARKKGAALMTEKNLQALSPSAAAASRLLKSGMTLTQIYSEYVETSDKLQSEKEENARLNQYLSQILQELEEKAPMLRKQREEYESSMQTVSQLNEQFNASMMASETMRIESDEKSRRCGELTRMNERLQRQNVDLSQQVRMLLKELEEARGNVVPLTAAENVSCNQISSSSQIISEKLVTFRSIEELQEQNQKLLEVVRDLSEKREQGEGASVDEQTSELKSQLSNALLELDEMKAARERQAQMVETIVRQRDTFQALLSDSSAGGLGRAGPLHASTPVSKSRSPARSPVVGQSDLQQQLDKANSDLSELTEKLNTCRTEWTENERMLNEQLATFRKENAEFRLQNTRLASQLDFHAERNKVLQSNISGFKKEIASLEDKNKRYSLSVAKHEQAVKELRENLMSVQEELSAARVKVESLQEDKALLQSSEARLLEQQSSWQREQSSRTLLLANLQTVQNNLERTEYETKAQYGRRIDTLEKDNSALREKLEKSQGVSESVAKLLEENLTECKGELEEKRTALANTQSLVQELGTTVEQLKQELLETETSLKAAQSRMDNDKRMQRELEQAERCNQLAEQVKCHEVQLTQSATRLKAVQEHLVEARSHAEQYKAIADSSEQALKEQTTAIQSEKAATEAELAKLNEVRSELEMTVATLEGEKQSMVDEKIALTQQTHALRRELQERVEQLEVELAAAIERRDEAVATEATAKQDALEQANIAKETQEKYERELMLHSTDVENLTAAKQQLESFTDRLLTAQAMATAAESTLKDAQACWVEQERKLKEEQTKLRTGISDLQKQNSVLLTELDAMSQLQTSRAGEPNPGEPAAAATAAELSAPYMSDNLLEVVRFLRREKEIAETRADVASAESTRLRQSTAALQQRAATAEEALAAERQAAQTSQLTSAQHADLMRRVDNLNLLQDSNKLLRQEKQAMEQQLKQLEEKVESGANERVAALEAMKLDMQVERDAAHAQCCALEAEVGRWRARTNQLIEQYSKVDPEAMKQLTEEKEDVRRQLCAMTEESDKQKAEITRVTNLHSNAQTELVNQKQQLAKLRQEKEAQRRQLVAATEDGEKQKNDAANCQQQNQKLSAELAASKQQAQRLNVEIAANKQQIQKLTTDLSAAKASQQLSDDMKDKDNEEKKKTITQLRKIGRKYKLQVEELQKELDTLKSVQPPVPTPGMEEQLASRTAELAAVREQLTTAETDLNASKQLSAENGQKVAALSSQLEQQRQDAQKLSDEVGQVRTELLQAKTEAAQKAEQLDKKVSQHRQILQTARTKLTAQKTEIEKLRTDNARLQQAAAPAGQTAAVSSDNQEMTSLRAVVARLEAELQQQAANQQQLAEDAASSLSAQLQERDEKVQQLEQQLSTAERDGSAEQQELQESEVIEGLRRDNMELKMKTQLLLKQLETCQKPQHTATAKPTVSTGPVERSAGSQAETPRRANIRPMSSQGVSQPRHLSATPARSGPTETRATASIRPMAVAPSAMVTHSSAQARTATVMPTTASSHEGESVGIGSAVVAGQVRPTQPVQAVPQHVVPPTGADTDMPDLPHGEMRTETEPIASTSATREVPCVAPTKRARDEQDRQSTEGAPCKRTRNDDAEAPQLTTTDQSADEAARPAQTTAEVAPAISLESSHSDITSLEPLAKESTAPVAFVEPAQQVAIPPQSVASSEPSQVALMVPASTQPADEAPPPPVHSTDPNLTESTVIEAGEEVELRHEDEEDNDDVIFVDEDDGDNFGEAGAQQPMDYYEEDDEVKEDEESNEEYEEHIEDDDDQEEDDEAEDGERITEDDQSETEEDDEMRNVYNEEEDEMQGYQFADESEEEEEEEEEEDQGPVVIIDDEDDEEEEDDDEDAGVANEGQESSSSAADSVPVMLPPTQIDTPASPQPDNVADAEPEEADYDDDVVDVESIEPPASQQSTTTTSSVTTTVAAATTTTVESPASVPVAPSHVTRPHDRLPVTARSHPTPFMLANDAFDAGDDGIVPSTPTLFVPKRNDGGFAEAVSSPQIPQQFIFGASSSEATAQSELTHLAAQAAGMDDTSIDLSQFDETGASRAVLVTSRSPPIICVQEASPPQEGSTAADSGEIEIEHADVSTQESSHTEQQQQQQQEEEQQVVVGVDTTGEVAPPVAGPSGDVAASQESSAEQERDDKPTPGGAKRKIEPIVWSDPGPSGAAGQTASTASFGQHVGASASAAAVLRKPRRGVAGRGPYRGSTSRGGGQTQTRFQTTQQQQQVYTRGRRGTRGGRTTYQQQRPL